MRRDNTGREAKTEVKHNDDYTVFGAVSSEIRIMDALQSIIDIISLSLLPEQKPTIEVKGYDRVDEDDDTSRDILVCLLMTLNGKKYIGSMQRFTTMSKLDSTPLHYWKVVMEHKAGWMDEADEILFVLHDSSICDDYMPVYGEHPYEECYHCGRQKEEHTSWLQNAEGYYDLPEHDDECCADVRDMTIMPGYKDGVIDSIRIEFMACTAEKFSADVLREIRAYEKILEEKGDWTFERVVFNGIQGEPKPSVILTNRSTGIRYAGYVNKMLGDHRLVELKRITE